MQKAIAGLSKMILPKHEYFAHTVLKNRFFRLVNKPVSNQYLFILSAPLCGSTLLHEIISSSPNVSSNNNWGTREGQKLPTTRQMMYKNDQRWNAEEKLDWHFIKQEWLKYWDVTKPVLLEKSPPNLVRALDIQSVFQPCYFIVLLRNPYAQCEGLMRRKKMLPKEAASLVVSRMEMQIRNAEQLQNALLLRYEDLCDSTEKTIDKLIDFLPELKRIIVGGEYKSHNLFGNGGKIENTNDQKINLLKTDDLKEINLVFAAKKDLLSHFQYRIIS